MIFSHFSKKTQKNSKIAHFCKKDYPGLSVWWKVNLKLSVNLGFCTENTTIGRRIDNNS